MADRTRQELDETLAAATLSTPRADEALARWQTRLLPFMQGTLVALTAFFFVATLVQLLYLQSRIGQAPQVNLSDVLPVVPVSAQASKEDLIDFQRLRASIALEVNTLERRHHHANVALMSQVWIRYLGVVTGMILSMVGAVFILGKLQERLSELTARVGAAEGALKSSSPGLILVVLGSVLVLATILDHRELVVTDRPVYLDQGTLTNPATTGTTPQLPPRE